MSSILVINAAGRETRVALVENGHIAEFYLERKKDKGVVGNVYKGRVVRVLPGMQAAFVDIGLEKAAFLYVSDVYYDPEFSRAQFELTEGEHDDAPEVPEFGADGDIEHEGLLEASPDGSPPRTITGEYPALTGDPAALAAEAGGAPGGGVAASAAPAAVQAGAAPGSAAPTGAEVIASAIAGAPGGAAGTSEADSRIAAPAGPGAGTAAFTQAAPGASSAGGAGPTPADESRAAGTAPSGATGAAVAAEAGRGAVGEASAAGAHQASASSAAGASQAGASSTAGAPQAGAAGAALDGSGAAGASSAAGTAQSGSGAAGSAGPSGGEDAQGSAATDTIAPGSAEAGPTGSEVVAEAIASSAAPLAGAEVVAAAIAQTGETRGERRGPRDHASREKHRRGRDERGRNREDEKPKPRKMARIEDLLRVGQEVLVQISKDPIGTKGARLTSHISIPGRHLVFMPTVDHVGISRRISNEKERRRLREIVDGLRPPGTGFIVRTVAENVPQEKLESDIRFLIEVWNETVRRNEKRGGPGLLHPDLDLILRATRDLFAQDVESLVIDDRDEYDRVLGFVTAQDPGLKDRVLLHDSEEPIFDAYGIEQEINRAVQRKVWLKSGGYLIFDQAEALTAIDVNSGRYVGKKSLEETITKINVEAAREIVYQLRLRNIGGIIICDFIDMEKPQNRDKVFKTLQEALGRDKAKTNVLRISELGLVEMTRKRVRESIGRMLHEDCSYCDGQGFVKTTTTVCYEIFRELRREAPAYKDPNLVVNCSTDVAAILQGDERLELRHLMDRYNKTIQVRAQAGYHREQYDIFGRSAQGSEHKVASSPETFEPANYGAPKRSGGEGRNERQDRGRDRGRGAGRGGPDRDRNRDQGGRREGGDRNRGPRGPGGAGGARTDQGKGQQPPEPGASGGTQSQERSEPGDAGSPPGPPATVGGD